MLIATHTTKSQNVAESNADGMRLEAASRSTQNIEQVSDTLAVYPMKYHRFALPTHRSSSVQW
eukprot:4460186-Pyramimonas_sp.AAC.1